MIPRINCSFNCSPRVKNLTFGKQGPLNNAQGDVAYYNDAAMALEALMAKFSDMMYEDRFERKIFIRNSAMGDYIKLKEVLDHARGFEN